MIASREAETESSTEKEEANNDSMLIISVTIMLRSVWIIEDRKRFHLQGSQGMTIDVAGLVPDVEAASVGLDV